MASCHSNHNFFALKEIVPKNVIILLFIICYRTSDSFLCFVTLIWCYDIGGSDIGGSDIGGLDIGGFIKKIHWRPGDIGGQATLKAYPSRGVGKNIPHFRRLTRCARLTHCGHLTGCTHKMHCSCLRCCAHRTRCARSCECKMPCMGWTSYIRTAHCPTSTTPHQLFP